MRDDFDNKTKEQLAKRVGFRCSNPECKHSTIGPKSGGGSNTTGVAAHITAASPGGPRYDSILNRLSANQFIMEFGFAKIVQKIIDNDTKLYTVMRLIMWKNNSAEESPIFLSIQRENLRQFFKIGMWIKQLNYLDF